MEEDQRLDLGPFDEWLCEGHFFKESDNHLYVSLRVRTWGDVEPVRIPLNDRVYGEHTLYIRWEAKSVYLRLNPLPEIATTWQSPDLIPPA
jgi:gamma-glutamylcysteine synthetase